MKMQNFDIMVDFGGIVIFDYEGLQSYFGGLTEGENLYKRFTKTDDG